MIVSLTCLVALILIIWFKTNAFVEYAQLLRIDKPLKVEAYDYVILRNGGNQSFPEFLNEYYNNFFTRLISCPICTSVWLGILISAILVIIKGILMISIFPIITLFGLGLYLIISKIL